MSSPESKINNLLDRIRNPNNATIYTSSSSPSPTPTSGTMNNNGGNNTPRTTNRPILQLDKIPKPGSPKARPHDLSFTPKKVENAESDKKLKEIMKISGRITINNTIYRTELKDMEQIEELGNGTYGHVVKMRHKLSGQIIAVKQMRRSGNSEENKRIVMDIEVVIKSHDCPYIVQCLGCFITDPEVWICMELMATCFDKLLKRLKQPIPEYVLGKVTVATVKALSYLKETHGVIHRDVKPSNILLDELGNVKLCDFGISGHLVDSMAQTKSAGCAGYIAPERIDPDNKNSNYDIRADVWSLGITLVELATGVFPYQDCKTDFEVLTKVVEQDPPTLPQDKEFSPEFRQFVSCCLIKDQKLRPKYVKLQNEPFIKRYESMNIDVGEWFRKAIQQADAVAANRSAARQNPPSVTTSRKPINYQKQEPSGVITTNGSAKVLDTSLEQQQQQQQQRYRLNNDRINTLPPDGRSEHFSRIQHTFQNASSNAMLNHQRGGSPFLHQKSSPDRQNIHQHNVEEQQQQRHMDRSYSPFQAYHNHIQMTKERRDYSPIPQRHAIKDNFYSSPIAQRKVTESPKSMSPLLQRRNDDGSGSRWSSSGSSPLPLRHLTQDEHQSCYNYENTSPILLQRFIHQQKQQAKEAEEAAKNDSNKKISSYIKLQHVNDKYGRSSSRHQSPDPPPRHSRGGATGSETQSPLAMHRNFLEQTGQGSPSFSKRYISPAPPMPPPRRLSESTSVPGSPQHVRARFHYTPEPQRRFFQNNDLS